MHHAIRTLAVALLLLGSAWAVANPPSAQQVVQETSERMIDALTANQDRIKTDRSYLFSLVEEIVLPHFDFERMSSWVLGKHWRTATPEQRAKFTKEFRNLLVRTYGTAMAEYSGQKIVYLPFRAPPNANDVTVKTQIEQEGGQPISISYSLYLKDNDWKVYDVVIENTSLVANYRSSFATEIKNGGLDGLIAKLETRSQQALTGGANGATGAAQ
ncbi:MAG: ABC transporter substrate-binding protein [Pseudomonadota bacterium]